MSKIKLEKTAEEIKDRQFLSAMYSSMITYKNVKN
jgi:hypothetical protein